MLEFIDYKKLGVQGCSVVTTSGPWFGIVDSESSTIMNKLIYKEIQKESGAKSYMRKGQGAS